MENQKSIGVCEGESSGLKPITENKYFSQQELQFGTTACKIIKKSVKLYICYCKYGNICLLDDL